MASATEVCQSTSLVTEVSLHLVFQTKPWSSDLENLRNLHRNDPTAFQQRGKELVKNIGGLPIPRHDGIYWSDQPSPAMIMRWSFEKLSAVSQIIYASQKPSQ